MGGEQPAARRQQDKQSEKEMELLLDEIPHATSHNPFSTYYFDDPRQRRRSASSSSASSSLSGNISPDAADPFRRSPDLSAPLLSPADLELSLLDRLRALHLSNNRRPFSPLDDARRSYLRLDYPAAYSDDLFSSRSFYSSPRPRFLDQDPSVAANQRLIAEAFLQSQQNRNSALLNQQDLHYSGYGGFSPRSLSSIRNMRGGVDDSDDGLFIKSKGMRREREKNRRSDNVSSFKSYGSLYSPTKSDSLVNGEGSIYYMAKDQHGCRLLQKKFDEGEPREIEAIFNAVVDHVVELMVNPFGNYLIQKLLDVCSEEQRMKILVVLTEDPSELVRISLNTHGTRAVQKLIETLRTRQQIALVVSALKPGFLDLIKDLNGNHVVQRCLQSLSDDDNKFIFDAAAKHCVDIATHRHGCCVLQRCIAHSSGEQKGNLVTEISMNGLQLSQDAFGNYVVQYILDLENPSATATLASQFEGNYVHLSMQKFSSNVVEKCLKVFREEDRARIIVELLSVNRFEQLLQDPYANYVIQSALGSTKGSLHTALVEAIRPHAGILRTSPYCKRIFSRTIKK